MAFAYGQPCHVGISYLVVENCMMGISSWIEDVLCIKTRHECQILAAGDRSMLELEMPA